MTAPPSRVFVAPLVTDKTRVVVVVGSVVTDIGSTVTVVVHAGLLNVVMAAIGTEVVTKVVFGLKTVLVSVVVVVAYGVVV